MGKEKGSGGGRGKAKRAGEGVKKYEKGRKHGRVKIQGA